MGRITRVTVGWVAGDASGEAEIELADLLDHCRPERVEDLLEDLDVLCRDVETSRSLNGERSW